MELHPLLQLFPFQETGNCLFGKGYRTIISDNEHVLIEAYTTGMGKVRSVATTVAILERSIAAKQKSTAPFSWVSAVQLTRNR